MSMQIYSERKALVKVAGHEAAALDVTVFQDTSKPLPASLQLALDLRVFGADVTNDWQKPLSDQAVQLAFRVPGAGAVQGQLTSVQGVDGNGHAVSWQQAQAVSFTLTGTAAVTVDILALVPGLPLLLQPFAAMLGGKVKIDIGSTTVIAPLHKGGT